MHGTLGTNEKLFPRCPEAKVLLFLASGQIFHQFVHPNINLEDPNPEIINMVSIESLPTNMIKKEINIVAKANFGFGDVNSCLIFSKFNN